MDRRAKYDRENTTRAVVKLNYRTDADILDMLAKTNNKQGLIKKALREYRENHRFYNV